MNDTTTSTRNTKATKLFLHADGSTSGHASAAAIAVLFNFADGRTLTAGLDSFNMDIQRCFTLNGVSQKIGDAYAGAKDVDEAYDRAANLLEALQGADATWLQRAESAGPRVSMLAEALHRVVPAKYTSIDVAAEALKAMTKEERAARAANAKVAAMLETIKAERASAKAAKMQEAANAATDADL